MNTEYAGHREGWRVTQGRVLALTKQPATSLGPFRPFKPIWNVIIPLPPSQTQVPDRFIYLGPSQEANSLQNRCQKRHALPVRDFLGPRSGSSNAFYVPITVFKLAVGFTNLPQVRTRKWKEANGSKEKWQQTCDSKQEGQRAEKTDKHTDILSDFTGTNWPSWINRSWGISSEPKNSCAY